MNVIRTPLVGVNLDQEHSVHIVISAGLGFCCDLQGTRQLEYWG
jgi:hypothetical protein